MRLSKYVAVALFTLACLVVAFPDLPPALAAATVSSVGALRQSWYVWNNSATTINAAPTYAPVPGDLLVTCSAVLHTGVTLTISDVIGATWNSMGTASTSSVTWQCWQRYAVAQDDYQADTITVTQSGTATQVYERVMEIGGVPTSSPFDTILMTPGPTATGTVTSPSLTTTAAGDVMLFYLIEDGNSGTWSAPTFPNFDVNQTGACNLSSGTPHICTQNQIYQDYVQVNPAPTSVSFTPMPTQVPAATATTASITMTTGTHNPLWLVAAIKQVNPDYSMLGANTGAGGYIPGGATAPPTSTPPPTPTPTPSATPPGQYHNYDYSDEHAASNTPYPGLYPTSSLWELGMVEGDQSDYSSSSGGTYAHYYHDNGVLYYQYTDAGAFEFTENYPQRCTSPCSNGSIPAWGPTLGIPAAAPTASSANNNSNFFQSGNSGTTHGMCYAGCYPNTTNFDVDPAQAFPQFLTVWDGSNAAQNSGPNALKTAINYYFIDVCCNNQGAHYIDAVNGNTQYPYSGTGTYLNSTTLIQSDFTTGLGDITNSTTEILTNGFNGGCPCTTFANLSGLPIVFLSLSQIAGGRLESNYGGGPPYAGTYPTLAQWQAMENESIIMTQSGKLALNKPRDNQDPRSASAQQARMFQAASIYLTWDPTYTYVQRTDCACGSMPNNDTTHNPTGSSVYPEQLFQPMGPMRSLGQNNISCNPNCTGSGIAALASSVPGVYFQEYHHGWHCELACEQAGGIAADKTDEGRCIVVVNVNTTSASFPPASDTSIDWVNAAGSKVAVLHNGGSGTPGGAEIDSGGWMDFTGGAPSSTMAADTGEIVCNPNYH